KERALAVTRNVLVQILRGQEASRAEEAPSKVGRPQRLRVLHELARLAVGFEPERLLRSASFIGDQRPADQLRSEGGDVFITRVLFRIQNVIARHVRRRSVMTRAPELDPVRAVRRPRTAL